MKRFFQSVSVLLLLLLWPVLSAEACGSEAPTHNAYLFSVYDNALMENSPFTSRVNDYWRKYVGSNNEYFDCINDSTAIMRAAQKKGDRETYAYLRLLYRYVAASNMINGGWDYPTKQQLSQYSRLLNVMLSSSRSYRGERLRTQYALMEMRALFAQKNYKAAADVWVKKGPATGLRQSEILRAQVPQSGRHQECLCPESQLRHAHLSRSGLRQQHPGDLRPL